MSQAGEQQTSAIHWRFASDRGRPAFRECQRRGREGPPLALARPGLPLGLNAVADEARAERWYQYSAYAVAPVGELVRLRVDEQRLADIEPSERDVLAVRLDVLSPEVAGISSLGNVASAQGIVVSESSALSMPCTVVCSQRAIAMLSE